MRLVMMGKDYLVALREGLGWTPNKLSETENEGAGSGIGIKFRFMMGLGALISIFNDDEDKGLAPVDVMHEFGSTFMALPENNMTNVIYTMQSIANKRGLPCKQVIESFTHLRDLLYR